MATITMKELLEAGVHFGHQTKRWNPKMKEYIFGERNGIYIIDLQKTVGLFRRAFSFVADCVGRGGQVLCVGTKKQAQDAIAEEALRSGQFFVNNRWLGGTLTNFRTIKQGIDRLTEACVRQRGRPLGEAVDAIAAELRPATGATEDDLLLLATEVGA